jgi:hypothetical protein
MIIRSLTLLGLMKSFKLRPILDMVSLEGKLKVVGEASMFREAAGRPLDDEHREKLRKLLDQLDTNFSHFGMVASWATLGRLRKLADKQDATYLDAQRLYTEFVSRFHDEAKPVTLLAIEAGKRRFFADPNLFGEQVAKAFPSTIVDIEEAGKCLALDRNTACVFHLMRVMESGLNALGASIGDPKLDPNTNPTWERFLARGRVELEKNPAARSPEWQAKGDFFADALANLRAVRTAWRNPAMHVRGAYDEEKALDIFHAVRGFMRHLATELHE